MASCDTMKKGEIYMCEECGFEIQVIKECEEEKCSEGSCGTDCSFSCCGEELVKKKK
jgi:hypothetical protein